MVPRDPRNVPCVQKVGGVKDPPKKNKGSRGGQMAAPASSVGADLIGFSGNHRHLVALLLVTVEC